MSSDVSHDCLLLNVLCVITLSSQGNAPLLAQAHPRPPHRHHALLMAEARAEARRGRPLHTERGLATGGDSPGGLAQHQHLVQPHISRVGA